jgi:chromosome segregation ATPase
MKKATTDENATMEAVRTEKGFHAVIIKARASSKALVAAQNNAGEMKRQYKAARKAFKKAKKAAKKAAKAHKANMAELEDCRAAIEEQKRLVQARDRVRRRKVKTARATEAKKAGVSPRVSKDGRSNVTPQPQTTTATTNMEIPAAAPIAEVPDATENS